jgi:hypothetical protein
MTDFSLFPVPFRAGFGEPKPYRSITDTDIARLAGRLPQPYLDLISADDLASYKNGALWTCDPDEWNDVLPMWTNQFPNGQVFMRAAFGDFYFFAEGACWTCLTQEARIMYCSGDMLWFLHSFLTNKGYLRGMSLISNAKKGLKAAGPLESDECYTWNPAFALGGSPDESWIGKGKAKISLSILSQLNETFIDRL